MKRRSSYKVTFFDREGPAGALKLQLAKNVLIVFGFSLLATSTLGSQKLGLVGWKLIVFVLGSSAGFALLAGWVGWTMGAGAASVASQVYMGGGSTPYEDQFSQEQARVMQRDYAGALALYEEKIASRPDEPRVRMAAADLYATHGGNPARAAELYREVQRIPGLMSGHDVYVSNKLADLYLGPLNQPGRALVEFRRIIERYPDSTAAQHARMALANVKSNMLRDPAGGG
jgi:hypothetical protein